ncbi:hypothetical protein [Tenggerimyces flavus]|uniref:DUF4185 domain-containing protein n=1 Tax=Tenggerimyces flavus TaxID=1708749 RepID=A0ABV7YK85_9ACTN|nr:hypothetical protein [Tenggerimyces flavus]MBM7784864.1 hypothetical protein [Tenggerimyces flavus]
MDDVFDFGIDGYRPNWLTGYDALDDAHGERLRALAGRRLTRTWVMWNLDDDEWLSDWPVLLDFEGELLEVNHQKFDELSITWSTIAPTEPPRWPGGFRHAFRDDVPPNYVALVGQTVTSAGFTVWHGAADDMANGTVMVHVGLTTGEVTIYNALDENGLHIGPSTGS